MRREGRGWRFIELAAIGSNGGRSYLGALLRIVLYPLAAAILLGIAAGFAGHGATAPLPGLLLQFAPIVLAGLALARGVERSHGRPWRTLIAPDLRIDFCRLVIGGGVEFVIILGQLALIYATVGWPWRVGMPEAPALLALAFVVIPLQAASEELLFRGYLTQALGRVLGSRLLIALAVGLIFGGLHGGRYGPLTALYFMIVSLIYSLVSLRDERLELAIGGHAAMNLFAFAAANASVARPAVIGAGAAALQFNAAALLVLLVHGALFYGLTRLLVRLVCERR